MTFTVIVNGIHRSSAIIRPTLAYRGSRAQERELSVRKSDDRSNRLGVWSCLAFLTTGLIYLLVLLFMMFSGASDPAKEPYNTPFSVLNLIAPLIAIPMWASVVAAAPRRALAWSLSACLFAAAWAVPVAANRFVGLILVPQSTASGHTAGLEWFATYSWPSFTRAFEMLGWGVFFPLACCFLAPVFTHGRLERAIAATLLITGVLSFVGATVGLALDSLTLMGTIAPIGWGLGPALIAALLLAWFRRPAASREQSTPVMPVPTLSPGHTIAERTSLSYSAPQRL